MEQNHSPLSKPVTATTNPTDSESTPNVTSQMQPIKFNLLTTDNSPLTLQEPPPPLNTTWEQAKVNHRITELMQQKCYWKD